MKIGIIGAGNMSRSLGIVWAEQGHDVFFGSRHAAKGAGLAAFAGNGTQGGTNDEAAAFGEVVLFTVREKVLSDVLTSVEPLAGKIVIDCNNRAVPADFAFDAMMGESLAEKTAADAPGARVVKAYNTMAQEVFEMSPEPLRKHGVSAYLCADDEAAKQTVAELSSDIGLVPVDCGPLRSARMLEVLGDFIRFMMAGMDLGRFATINVKTIPEPAQERLGGRGFQP